MFNRRLDFGQHRHVFIPLPPPNHPDLMKKYSHIKLKSTKDVSQLTGKMANKSSKVLQPRREHSKNASDLLYKRPNALASKTEKISSDLCSARLARVHDLTKLKYPKTSDNTAREHEEFRALENVMKTKRHVSNLQKKDATERISRISQPIQRTTNILKRPNELSQTIPTVNRQTSTTNTHLSNPKISSILEKHYKIPQIQAFTWVKYSIPKPPPNLEEVERKLYPHRFKIIIEEISTFIRIPTPPPHMPESMKFPLLSLIPSPPPDIPEYLLTQPELSSVRVRTSIVPNPIRGLIPSPPPDIPEYLLTQPELSSVRVRTSIVPNPIRGLIPFPPPDIPDLLTDLSSVKPIIAPNPIRGLIPPPPPNIPESLLTESGFPPPPPDIPLDSGPMRLISLLSGRTLNSKLSLIPLPPPDIPIFPPPPPPLELYHSFSSSDSWDEPPVDPSDFRSLHLQEIVDAAKLKEKLAKDKKKLANFRILSLQEIINAENVKEAERRAKDADEKNWRSPNFRRLHLEELKKAFLKKEKEMVMKSITKLELQLAQGKRTGQPSTQPILLNLPNLKKEEYYHRLLSKLGLAENGNKYSDSAQDPSNLTFRSKIELLKKVETAISTGNPPVNSLLPPSLLSILQVPGYPDLSKHHSHMSWHLTPEIYRLLSKRVTKSGFTFHQAIQVGIDNPGDTVNLTVGCIAGDEDSYSEFAELFDLVIETVHNGYSTDKVHYSDFDPIHFSDGYFDPNYVLSCRVRAGRSIRGFPLLPQCTRVERRNVESIVKLCLNNMPHPFKGAYHPLSTMSVEEHRHLSSQSLLFHKPTSPLVTSSRMIRDWPDARGLWVDRDKCFSAWVNEKDHVRLISMAEGGDLGSVFERFCLGVQLFEMVLNLRGHEVMKNDHLGYIVTCPSNLGTGMKVSLRVKLPIVSSLPEFHTIIQYLNLDKRDTLEQGIFDISNRYNLGYTEVGLVQEVIHSVQLLIRLEQGLWSGYGLLEILREKKPGLADVLIAGVYPSNPLKRMKCARKLIPEPPPDMPQI